MYKKVMERRVGNHYYYEVFFNNEGQWDLEESFKYTYRIFNPIDELDAIIQNSPSEDHIREALELKKAIPDSENFLHAVIYNPDGTVLEEAYDYFNHYLKSNEVNTLNSKASAICRLYDFCRIVNCEPGSMTRDDISLFTDFLTGELKESANGIGFNQIRRLGPASINILFSAVRDYVIYIAEANESFFEGRDIAYREKNRTKLKKKYSANRRVVDNHAIPENISPAQYQNILSVIADRNANDVFSRRNCLLIEMLYVTGARIGELISLTTQDIELADVEGKQIGRITIRNRITDKAGQRSKRKQTIKNPKRKQVYNVDYRTVFVPKHIYDEAILLLPTISLKVLTM